MVTSTYLTVCRCLSLRVLRYILASPGYAPGTIAVNVTCLSNASQPIAKTCFSIADACIKKINTAATHPCSIGRDVTLTLVTSLVLSRLDYCNSVLAGLPASILAPLQRVLHAAARLVNDLRPHDHVSPTLKELPIMQRVDYKLCLLCTKWWSAMRHPT